MINTVDANRIEQKDMHQAITNSLQPEGNNLIINMMVVSFLIL